MKLSIRVFFFLLLGVFGLAAAHSVNGQCVSLTGTTYTQDFNTLATSGTADVTTLPTGILFLEANTNANTTYVADGGTGTAGNTYSYGTGTDTDRALGELTSGTLQSTLGACFTNNTGSSIASISLGYTGEQWRLGAADANIDRLDFQYSLNATALNNGTWTDVDTLDFTSPSNTTTGSKDGNAVGNRTVFAPTSIALPGGVANGATFFIRWLSTDIGGADDGLAIDDLSLATFPPTAAQVSVSGRITNGKHGISGVRLVLTDDAGVSRSTLTNNFGIFRFEGVEAGRIYVVEVSSKRYAFDHPTRVLQVDDAVENLDFEAFEH